MDLERYLETRGHHHPPVTPREVRRRLALFLNMIDAVRVAHARGAIPLQIQAGSFLVQPGEARGAPRLRLDDACMVSRDDPRLPLSPELVEVHRLGVLMYRLVSEPAGAERARGRRGDLSAMRERLRAVMVRALAPNPEHRFASVEALASAVRELFDRTPAFARRTASRRVPAPAFRALAP
jgi:hypothetical protein